MAVGGDVGDPSLEQITIPHSNPSPAWLFGLSPGCLLLPRPSSSAPQTSDDFECFKVAHDQPEVVDIDKNVAAFAAYVVVW